MKYSRYTTTQFLNKMWTKISFASKNKTIFAVVLKNISCFVKQTIAQFAHKTQRTQHICT